MAEVTTTTRKEVNVFASADGTVEVTVWENSEEFDGRGRRGGSRKSKEIARFTMTAREAAKMAGEIADGIAYGFKCMADGVPEDKW